MSALGFIISQYTSTTGYKCLECSQNILLHQYCTVRECVVMMMSYPQIEDQLGLHQVQHCTIILHQLY